jgi:molybdate transport system substrate-binding protein
VRVPSSVVIASVVLAVALAACSSGAASPGTSTAPVPAATEATIALTTPSATVDLTVYGASSLKGVLAQVKTAYEAAVPGTTLTIATGSSATLETQIEQGAPADVFLSADTKNPQKLVDDGFAAGDLVPFAGNLLTVVVPADNPGALKSPADLAKAGVKVIAAGADVPITKYATQLVANLAKEPGYPADFAAAYAANIVSMEVNVSALLSKIELGEGDAGIVYVTDANASSKVATIDVPDTANVPATYAGVVVNGSAQATAATAFLDWLAGPDGQAILAGFGFLPAP